MESGDVCRPGENRRADAAINQSLSQIKVCRSESQALENTLRKQYFTKWVETCAVNEFHGYSKGRLEDLFARIHDTFKVTGNDVRAHLKGIQWASQWSYKVYEFTYGSVMDSGTVYFGMIALGKEQSSGGDSFDAVTCLYKLDFTVAKIRVEKKTPKRTLGVRRGTRKRVWYETKKLDFVTQNALTNFCRVKALDTFCMKGLTSSINEVSSLAAIN